MNKIESFKVDHTKLLPDFIFQDGIQRAIRPPPPSIYGSPTPTVNPALDGGAMHTIEHLCATYLRNSKAADDVIYFGPMGCRTGFTLLCSESLNRAMFWKLSNPPLNLRRNLKAKFRAKEEECGNYLYHDLPMARYYAKNILPTLKNTSPLNIKELCFGFPRQSLFNIRL